MRRLVTVPLAMLICIGWIRFAYAQACPRLEGVPLASSFRFGLGGFCGQCTMGLAECANMGSTIECDLRLTLANAPDREWAYNNMDWFKTKLVDNFGVEHKQTQGYFLNGHCEQQDPVDLGQGDSIWLVQGFDGAQSDIRRVKMVFPTGLTGPVRPGRLPAAAH
jgi:hypothetical protein